MVPAIVFCKVAKTGILLLLWRGLKITNNIYTLFFNYWILNILIFLLKVQFSVLIQLEENVLLMRIVKLEIHINWL